MYRFLLTIIIIISLASAGCGKPDKEVTPLPPAPSAQEITAKTPPPPVPPSQPTVTQTPVTPTEQTSVQVDSGSSTPVSDEEARKKRIKELLQQNSYTFSLTQLDYREVITELIKLLIGSDWNAREVATNILITLEAKEAIPDLIIAFQNNKDINIREQILDIFTKLGAKEYVIPQIIEQLRIDLYHNENYKTRVAAAETLGKIGDKKIIPDLMEALRKDMHGNVLDAVSDALVKIGERGIIPELIEFINKDESRIRYVWAIYVIGELGAKEAIPKLIQFLKDKERPITTAYALAKLGAKEAVPEIIKLLDDESYYVREGAIKCLITLDAKEAVPEIMKLLSIKPNEANEADVWDIHDMRRAAIKAVVHFGVKETIPDLIKLANEGYIDAIYALGKLGAKETGSELIQLLKNEDEDIRHASAKAIGELGIIQAIPEIVRLSLIGNDDFVRSEVIGTFHKLCEQKESIPELIKLLEHENEDIRSTAVWKLRELNAKESVSDIKKLLYDKDQFIRAITAIALIELGNKEAVSKSDIENIKWLSTEIRWIQYHGLITTETVWNARARAALKELGVEVPEEKK